MNDNILEAFEEFDFYETEIDDGCTALIYESSNEEDYALITDTEGVMPADLEQEIIFAAYSASGAFSWSVSFENSHQLLELLQNAGKGVSIIDAVKEYRDSGDYY